MHGQFVLPAHWPADSSDVSDGETWAEETPKKSVPPTKRRSIPTSSTSSSSTSSSASSSDSTSSTKSEKKDEQSMHQDWNSSGPEYVRQSPMTPKLMVRFVLFVCLMAPDLLILSYMFRAAQLVQSQAMLLQGSNFSHICADYCRASRAQTCLP